MNSSRETAASAPRFATRAAVALISLLAAALLARAWLAGHETYDPDEFFTLGSAWRIGRGQLPYLDFLEGRSPVLFKLYSLPLAALGEGVGVLDAFRWLHFGFAAVLFSLLFVFARRTVDGRAAPWAIAILSCFVFFLRATVQIRPDALALNALLAAAIVLVGKENEPPSAGRSFAAGALAGVAIAFHFMLAFPVAGAGLWLLLLGRGKWKRAACFGGAATAVFLASYLPVFGTRIFAGWSAHLAVLRFLKVYLAATPDTSATAIGAVLREDAAVWALTAAALVYLHLPRAGRGASGGLLPLLMSDASLLALFFQDRIYPQRFAPAALFASVAAAVAVREWIKRLELRFSPRKPGAVEFAAAVALAAAGAIGGASWLANQQAEIRFAQAENSAAAARPTSAAPLDPETARQLMSNQPTIGDPFRRRPKKQRDAQVRFILANSRSTDEVFTNWLNPPFRGLPTGAHDGFHLALTHRLARPREDMQFRDFLRRFVPYYSPEDATLAQSLRRIFEGARPALILMEGGPAEQFLASADFRRWLAEHYQLRFDTLSNSFFALRN